jgi:hypothetical protein
MRRWFSPFRDVRVLLRRIQQLTIDRVMFAPIMDSTPSHADVRLKGQ